MQLSYNKIQLALILIAACVLVGFGDGQVRSAKQTDSAATFKSTSDAGTAVSDSVVWAINVGGAEYLGADGIHYQADSLQTPAELGRIKNISGAQDATVYKTYRAGEMQLQLPVENGNYNITFLFAEPENIAVGERVFNIFAEDRQVVKELDIRLARYGSHKLALDRSVMAVEVSDGQLNIDFKAITGKPVLNALIVRKKIVREKGLGKNIERQQTPLWELVWSDEFEREGPPDAAKWSHDIWPARKVNDEDQAYTDRLQNARVEAGNLVIEAHQEDYAGAEYTSGRIHSKGKGDFLYGRAEVRAKLPAGQGTWAAIWMLPSDPYKYATSCAENEDMHGSKTCDAWPNSGEIDVMEHVGYDMGRVLATLHTQAYYSANGEQRQGGVEGRNVDQAFHDYAIEWTPERLDVFFDDSPYFTYLNESAGWQAWPFDHPYHIILNLAIGGEWGRAGGPIDDRIFPARMEIDYVRVFKSVSPVMGAVQDIPMQSASMQSASMQSASMQSASQLNLRQ